jgi:hypothetical protein
MKVELGLPVWMNHLGVEAVHRRIEGQGVRPLSLVKGYVGRFTVAHANGMAIAVTGNR